MPRHYFWILSLVLVAGVLSSCKRELRGEYGNVALIENNDADMKAAIAKARASLPQFWQKFENRDPGEEKFAIKVQFKENGQSEFIWVDDIERKDGKIFGRINNDPNMVKKVKPNDPFEIPEADIADWGYLRNGKVVGNYTLRVLFKQMPAEQVQFYKERLADP